MTTGWQRPWTSLRRNGGLAMVHAENGLVTDYLEDRSLKKREDQKKVFLKTRPDYLEAEAIFRAITIATVTHCPLYMVHLSTAKGIIPVQRAREEGTGGLCGNLPPIPHPDRSGTFRKRGPWQRSVLL